MSRTEGNAAGGVTPDAAAGQWAELADLSLRIAREIQFRGYADPRAVSLSTSEGMVMRVLQKEGEIPQARIAEATGLQRTHLSVVLRGLKDKGLIERRTSPEDRRGVIVRPTNHGLENYRIVRGEWAAAVARAAGPQDADLRSALELLSRVEAGLVAMRPVTAGGAPS